jgi:outer membrane protein, multidrug efflux system
MFVLIQTGRRYVLAQFWGLFLLGIMAGCQIFTPAKLPPPLTLPPSFTGTTDSVSIGRVPIHSFFEDTTLAALIDTALRNNFDLQMAIQRVEIAKARVMVSRGALLPAFNVAGASGIRKFGAYTMDGVGNYDTNFSEYVDDKRQIPDPLPDYYLGLESSWEIDIWGRLKNQKRAAYARFLATQKGRQLVVTSLVAQVASLYYEMLTLDNQLETIRENIILQERALNLINVQKEAGRVTELAVQQFSAQLLNTRGLEIQIRQQILASENALNLLLGRFPQPILRGKPILEQAFPDEIRAGIPSDMLQRRPDIQQAELELIAAKADVQSARAAFLPSITINSFAGFNAFKASLLFVAPSSIAYGVLAGLSAPLFNQNLLKAGYRQTVAGNAGAVYAYQKTVIAGYEEVVTNLRRIENYASMATVKEQEVTVLQQAVTTANDLFSTGFATYLEVITAQRSVLEAELNLAEIRNEQFMALINLYRALGGGWSD